MKRLTKIFMVLFLFSVPLRVTFAQDITISSNATWDPGTYTYNNVLITNNAVLTFRGAITLNCANLTIDSGARLSADVKGFPYASGPGAGGTKDDFYGGSFKQRGSGAGYGGRGGAGDRGLPSGGLTYGSSLTPQDLGSGGGTHRGGSGGGAIRFIIFDTLSLNGTLSANAGDGTADGYYEGGGGSGGSHTG